MSYQATVYKVMIASPSDVQDERNLVREVLYEWNAINADKTKLILLPVGWETHIAPEMGDSPQSIINKRILKDCDLLVGIFWTRIGTSTTEYASGSVEEIEEHIKQKKPAMIYFSESPVSPNSIDDIQFRKLKEFKESCRNRGIYRQYIGLDNFKEKFKSDLQITLNSNEYFSTDMTISSEKNHLDEKKLSPNASRLLLEAIKDQKGFILYRNSLSGCIIQTNRNNMINDDLPKTKAIWVAALDELEKKGFIKPESEKRNIFSVTKHGYEMSENCDSNSLE